MISEVDLRDWDKVDFKSVHDGADKLVETAYLSQYQYIVKMYDFIKQVEELKKKQMNPPTKRLPALFRKGE